MSLRTRLLTGRVTAAVVAASLLALPMLVSPAEAQPAAAPEDRSAAAGRGPAVKVMTRNLYLGTDIMRPIRAVQGISDPGVLIHALGHATDEARDIVDQTDFTVRSRLLAREIATQKPDLVGLQEVALWRHGPIELDPALITVPNAETVDYDFLRLLRKQLRAQGARYRPVSVNWLSDVEAPAFEGTIGQPDFANGRDVRLTMRDVILKRVDNGMKVLRHREKQYRDGLEVVIAGKVMNFTRGFNWVDLRGRSGKFRFINTHLEAFSSDMAYAQAQQMLDGPGDYRGTTMIVCDCNSDPLNGSVKSDPPVSDTMPHWAPYWLITSRNDFTDAWLQWKQAQEGWTSGLSELVNDATPAAFDHRIDMVFARTGDGGRLKVTGGTVTGDALADRDPATGLWPSDHAGVVLRLRGIR